MSKDNLGFKQEEGNTYFTLKKGTTFKFAGDEITLNEDAEFCHAGGVGREGLVGLIIAAGASGENVENFAHTIQRKIDGKKTNVEVTYDGTGAARYKAAGSEERPSFTLPGEALPGEPAEGAGAVAQGIAAGVSAGAGVDLTTKEAGKLDNPLESMESDAQLLAKHGASDKKAGKKGKK